LILGISDCNRGSSETMVRRRLDPHSGCCQSGTSSRSFVDCLRWQHWSRVDWGIKLGAGWQ